MLEIAVVGFLSAFGGGLLGGLAVWSAVLRRPREAEGSDAPGWIEPDVARQIDEAARGWAAAHSRPEATASVAAKLRLAHHLRVGRDRRW